jgi:hypothetical protein
VFEGRERAADFDFGGWFVGVVERPEKTILV